MKTGMTNDVKRVVIPISRNQDKIKLYRERKILARRYSDINDRQNHRKFFVQNQSDAFAKIRDRQLVCENEKMNRSFSNIFSSTYSDDLNRNEPRKSDKIGRNNFIAKLGIGLIEFLIFSIFLSYGIIFLTYVDLNTYSTENGLWTPIMYITTWHLAGPWSRHVCEIAENSRHNLFKFVISIAVVCICIGIVLPGHVIFYGIFGGIFSNLITIQLRFVATEKFNTDPKTFEGNIQSARALSLLIMPHLMLLIVDNYTMEEVKFIFAAFLLNTIPAVLIIIPPNNFMFTNHEVSRYHTLTAFSTQMREMRDFTGSASPSGIIYNETLCIGNEESEDESNKDLLQLSIQVNTDNAVVNEDIVQSVPLTHLNIQHYFSKAGVSILPQIPEEGGSDKEDLDVIDSKRLSRISTKLEQLNQIDREDKITEVFNINDLISNSTKGCQEKIENIEFIPNYTQNNNRLISEFKSIKNVSCCHCQSYRIFKWRRRLRHMKDIFTDNFIRPLLRSLKVFYFYLALFSKSSLMLVSTIYITLGPYLVLEKNKDIKVEDTTFFLSYIAFAWCLFLMLLPLVITLSREKTRMTFIIGLGVTAVSMLLMTKYKLSNDFVILSCLLFGFGYGITSYTETILYRAHVGARRWNQIQGTLETLSAIFVILIYFVLNRIRIDIEFLLPYIGFVIYLANAILWIVIPVLVYFFYVVKNRFKSEDELDFT